MLELHVHTDSLLADPADTADTAFSEDADSAGTEGESAEGLEGAAAQGQSDGQRAGLGQRYSSAVHIRLRRRQLPASFAALLPSASAQSLTLQQTLLK